MLNLIPVEHVPAARTTLRPPIVEIEPPHIEPVGCAVVDGLNWTFRGGFERILASVPAAVWKNPASQGWKLVKSNSSREVWRASIQGAAYYVKYYHCSSWRARIKRLLRGPVCLKEWRGGIFAIEQGIPAVRPAGYVGDISCNGRPASILVTEAVEAAQPLDEFWRLLQTDRDVRRRRGDTRILIDRLAALIAGSHQAGFEHLDMHPANILVQTVGPRRYRTVFVDLQSARLGVPIDDVAVVRNLTQLNQWFRRNSTTADRLRFLRAYVRWRNEHETAHAQGRPLSLSFDQLVRAMERRAAVHAALICRQRDRRVARNGRYFARIKLPGGWTGMAAVQSKRPQEGSGASARV
ncbi:MAG: phosphotransferase, partial [Planctomycetes bacterium]|nr:phosphotransferase [Planctomycetota bacterium]